MILVPAGKAVGKLGLGVEREPKEPGEKQALPLACRACLPWAGAMVCVALSCAFAVEPAAAAVPTVAARSCAPQPHFQGIPGQDARAIDPAAPNPLAGLRLYVDPREPANRSYAAYRRRGQRGKAALMA